MKHLFVTAVAAVATLVFGGAAVAKCTPVPPKKWEGGFMVATGGWVSGLTFRLNGCSFGGLEQLNGFDAAVLEVEGYGGLPALFEYTAAGAQIGGLTGTFFTKECEAQDSFTAERDTPTQITIPANAHWLLLEGANWAVNVEATMESKGMKCEKKKRGRK